MTEPDTALDQRFSAPGAEAAGWDETRRALEEAQLSWICTVRADGRPHLTPLVAVWLDGALYFSTGADEQKAVNLRGNPHVLLLTGCHRWNEGLDVVAEGDAVRVTDDALSPGSLRPGPESGTGSGSSRSATAALSTPTAGRRWCSRSGRPRSSRSPRAASARHATASPNLPRGSSGLRAGEEARAARLPWFYGCGCHPVRVRTAYRCRAYPDEAQQQMLARTFGCVRLVWNRTLAERHARYQAEGKGVSYAESDRALTAMKKDPELGFLSQVSSVPLQQALRHQHAAFQAFFARRARYPRFKSRRGRQSATYTRSAFRMRDGQLWLAKTAAPLSFTWTWPDRDVATLDPTSVTVAKDPAGRWFVTFHVDAPDPAPLPATGENAGVDVGLKDFAVLSTGAKIPHPKDWERHEKRLKRYQRKLARCQRGSANRAKAKRKVARAHARITDARRDFLHKASTDLVRRFDVIAVEDLNVFGMVRNRSLARAISCTGWAGFRAMLEYKAQRYGRTILAVDRFYPSSKTCSACGHLLAALSLGTRQWTCPGFGTRHDRDHNAAKNILAAGLAVTACGGSVRRAGATRARSPVKQEPRPVRAGIPVP